MTMMKWSRKKCLWTPTKASNSVLWNGEAHVEVVDYPNQLGTEIGNERDGVPTFNNVNFLLMG